MFDPRCAQTTGLPWNDGTIASAGAMAVPGDANGQDFMYSFPAEGEGRTWRQGQARRIFAPALAGAWRAAAGGCGECGEEIEDPCIGACISKALDVPALTSVWNSVAADLDTYPNYGVPGSSGIFLSRSPTFCVDLAGGDSSWQTPIQLWQCNGLVNQAWVWTDDKIILAGSNSPGTHRIEARAEGGCTICSQARGESQLERRVRSGKCVDLPGGDARNGNYLWLWECTGGDSQGWILDGQQIKLKANPGATATQTHHSGLLPPNAGLESCASSVLHRPPRSRRAQREPAVALGVQRVRQPKVADVPAATTGSQAASREAQSLVDAAQRGVGGGALVACHAKVHARACRSRRRAAARASHRHRRGRAVVRAPFRP